MKNRVLSLLLIGILLLGMLTICGCTPKSVITVNGEKLDSAYYSFYIHWQRDYFKELLKGYGYDIATCMDNYYTETETVRQSIISSAKTQYISFIVVSEQFDKLGLSLNEEQNKELEKIYNDEWVKTYGEKGMKTILKELGLNKEEFLSLLSVSIKSNAILDYYYGENGVTPITEKDKQDYFKENYYRFKYVLLSKTDEKDNKLPESEIEKKRQLAQSIVDKVNAGSAFEDLLPEYSEDYTKITDSMTADEKKSAEESNQKAVTEGLICDSKGIFNQTLYSYYGFAVNKNIVDKLKESKNGDINIVEVDDAIWVIKEYDIHEDASYYEKRKQTIFESLYGDDFNAMYTRWLAALDYKFDEDALSQFDPGEFSDMFSEVYDMDKGPESTEK